MAAIDGGKHREPVEGLLPRLRLLAIILPALGFVLIDGMQHNIGEAFWHSWPGILLEQAAVFGMIVGFAYVVFGVIDRAERARMGQAAQLEALQNLSNSINEELDLDVILTTGLRRILDSTRADAGLVCRVDPEHIELSHLCKHGLGPHVHLNEPIALQSDPVASLAASSGRSVRFSEFAHDPEVQAAMAAEGIRSGISVPLRTGSRVNGILAVAYREEHEVSVDEQEFLESAARQLGLVVHNASLYQSAVERQEELSALLSVASGVTSGVDMDSVLAASLTGVLALVPAEHAEIWMLDGEEWRVRRAKDQGAASAPERGLCPPSIVKQIADGRIPFTIGTLGADPNPELEALAADGWGSLCALPIRYQNETLGVLALLSGTAETCGTDSIDLLGAVAAEVAPAIANISLHQQLRDAAVMSEREWISREMHDGLAQVLGYVNTQVLATKKLLSDGRLDRAEEELSHLETAAREVYSDVREGILALRTVPGDSGGMVPALRRYVEHLREMSGMMVELTVTSEAEALTLSPTNEIQLIRIIQEALSNARRHSRADRVEVRLDRDERSLNVLVVDNGVGFDVQQPASGRTPRFGLQTMRERAEALGGVFSIESAIGQGTTVRVSIPLERS